MPRSPAEQIALTARLIRDRTINPMVKARGDAEWMAQVAEWLEYEAECAIDDPGDEPAAEMALNVARAYLGTVADA